MAGNYALWGSWLPERLTLVVIDEAQSKLLGLHEIPIDPEKWQARQLSKSLKDSPLFGADYGKSSLLIFQEACSLLPQCDPEQAQKLFHQEHPHATKGDWMYHSLSRLQSQVVWKYAPAVRDFLNDHFPDASLRHYSGAAIEEGLFISKNIQKPIARLIIQSGWVHILLLDQGKLHFSNRFPAQVTEDVLYYLFFALEQLDWKREAIEVLLSGHLEAVDLNQSLLEEYLPQVSEETVDEALRVDLIHAPVALRNLSLLNLFLCE